MPKEIVSAADILGEQATEVAVVDQAPVAEVPQPKESETPAVGFENPPEEKPSEDAAPAEVPAATEAEALPASEEKPVEAAPVEAPSAADVLAEAADESKTEEKPLPAPVLNSQAKPAEDSKAPTATPEKPTEAPAPVVTGWRFIKNIHPGEKIILKDGTEYPFPTTGVHTVTDPKVAAQILEIADRYHIVQQ